MFARANAVDIKAGGVQHREGIAPCKYGYNKLSYVYIFVGYVDCRKCSIKQYLQRT